MVGFDFDFLPPSLVARTCAMCEPLMLEAAQRLSRSQHENNYGGTALGCLFGIRPQA